MSRILQDAPPSRAPATPPPQTALPAGSSQQRPPIPLTPQGPSLQLVAAFRRAAGDGVATHAFPKHIRKGVLTVGVDSPVWLQELSFMKEKLAQNMSREVGEQIVGVHLVISKRPPSTDLAKGSTSPLRAGTATERARGYAAAVAAETAGLPPMPELPPGVAAEVKAALAPLAGEPEVFEAALRALSRWRQKKRP